MVEMMARRPPRKQAMGLERAHNRQGVDDGKAPPAVRHAGLPRDRSICERCGGRYERKTWHPGGAGSGPHRAGPGFTWVVCAACRQAAKGEYRGRVLLRGDVLGLRTAEVLARIRNVDAQAQGRRPDRRVVGTAPDADGYEVVTTSQKLAHRIARELRKAFGGEVTYTWNDEGELLAVWRSDGA